MRRRRWTISTPRNVSSNASGRRTGPISGAAPHPPRARPDRARLLTVGEWGRGYNRRDAPLASEQEGASPSPRDAREDDREGQASSREAFLFAPRRWSPEHADPSSPEGYFFAPIDDAFAPSPPRTPSPHPQITRGRTGPRDGGGLSPRAIRSLPRASFALHGSSGCASECAVCLRDFAPGEANLTRVPRCAHLFHAECLAPWLMRSSACPRCRGKSCARQSRARARRRRGRHSRLERTRVDAVWRPPGIAIML